MAMSYFPAEKEVDMTMLQKKNVRRRELLELNLVDRFLFDETMENKEAYEAFVGILLDEENLKLTDNPETEKELRISPQLREVRLDVVSFDDNGSAYYAEMQQKNTYNLQRRSRYYQAQVDVALLEPGEANFNKLNDGYFILVAPFDIFGKGLYRYTFTNVCKECPSLELGDGATRIFINTMGTNAEDFSEEFLDLMRYITDSDDSIAEKSSSKRIKQIHKQVTSVRLSEKAGVRYMQKWEELVYAKEDGKEEGREEGLEEGQERKLIEMICKKLRKGKSPEEIADDLEEDLSTITAYCDELEKYAPDYDTDTIFKERYYASVISEQQ